MRTCLHRHAPRQHALFAPPRTPGGDRDSLDPGSHHDAGSRPCTRSRGPRQLPKAISNNGASSSGCLPPRTRTTCPPPGVKWGLYSQWGPPFSFADVVGDVWATPSAFHLYPDYLADPIIYFCPSMLTDPVEDFLGAQRLALVRRLHTREAARRDCPPPACRLAPQNFSDRHYAYFGYAAESQQVYITMQCLVDLSTHTAMIAPWSAKDMTVGESIQ